jgi:acetyl-CoA carboxylase biotin carboxyl carrier protein
MVGTFYRAPKPGAESFVAIGASVKDNSVIAIIEVMKLINSIPAGCNGTIVEILAEDARFVEKGQLLMRVKPSA